MLNKDITKTGIINFLKEKKEYLRETFHVAHIALIGSYSKESESSESDIDFKNHNRKHFERIGSDHDCKLAANYFDEIRIAIHPGNLIFSAFYF